MGIEYSITFSAPEPEATEAALRRLGCTLVAGPAGESFEFRSDRASSEMPDATVTPSEGGLYFCDHGGFGREFLGCLIAVLVEKYGELNIRELEG
jgi:hypothetical protein